MNPAAVSSLLTAIALLAVLVAVRGVAGTARTTAVGARLATVYWLVAALLACRLIVDVSTGVAASFVVVATMMIAAWLPLAGLRLVEELLRRHAPRVAKLGTLGGALGFSVLALAVGFVWSTGALIALALFQAVTIAVMVTLLLRHRGDLSQAERAAADTFLIALVATIPLALTDFRALVPDLPVRGGSFAILLMVLATSRVVEGGGAPRRLLADIALCLGGGGLVASVTSGDVAATGLGFALTALALLVERFARSRGTDGGLVSALASIDDVDPQTLLASHPMLSSGRIVEGAALADYPATAIAALTRHRSINDATADPDARDAARDLLEAHAATHLVRLGAVPPRFLAVSAGSFVSARTDAELTLLARLIEAKA